jgi:hypothetical protein
MNKSWEKRGSQKDNGEKREIERETGELRKVKGVRKMGKTEGQRFSGLHRSAPDDQGIGKAAR